MTSTTSIKNIPTSTSLSPKTPTAKSKDSKKQSKEKTISETDSPEKITMTSFTSIKNISKTITLFLSSHTAGFSTPEVLLKDLSNSDQVYGVDSDTKLSKRQKTIKTVIQTNVSEFVELYSELVAAFPEQMSEELRSTIIKDLWSDFAETQEITDKLRSKPTNDGERVFNKSAYMYFCDGHRQIVKDTHEKLSPSETIKELAILWKTAKTDKTDVYDKYVKMADDNRVVDHVKEALKEEKKELAAKRLIERAGKAAEKLANVASRAVKSPVKSGVKKITPRSNFMTVMKNNKEDDEEFQAMTKKEQGEFLKEIWNDLSNNDKAMYKLPVVAELIVVEEESDEEEEEKVVDEESEEEEEKVVDEESEEEEEEEKVVDEESEEEVIEEESEDEEDEEEEDALWETLKKQANVRQQKRFDDEASGVMTEERKKYSKMPLPYKNR
jgi:hypothetical protein